jgi:septum formation protein
MDRLRKNELGLILKKYMLEDYKIILASKSPRRRQLLDGLNIPFEVVIHEVDEVFPEGLPMEEIPVYLAKLKAEPFAEELSHDALVITADTIVWIDGTVLGKPNDYDHAAEMLRHLSGKKHIVVTGICLTSREKQVTFSASTDVYFKELSDSEIDYYLEHYRPYDKAGSYGVQEWIGYIAITRIEGSYFNVMGLPVQRLYEELRKF